MFVVKEMLDGLIDANLGSIFIKSGLRLKGRVSSVVLGSLSHPIWEKDVFSFMAFLKMNKVISQTRRKKR